MDLGFSAIDIAQGVIIGIGALLGAVGVRRGIGHSAAQAARPTEVVTEVAGALVDSSSVHKLTAAIEAFAFELMQSRKCTEKVAKALEDCHEEMAELRHAIQRLSDIIIQKR